MKSFLDNRLEAKQRKSSKFFQAPTKEQVTMKEFMRAGDDYGTGFTQPVGTRRESRDLEVIPQTTQVGDAGDFS